MNDNAKNTQKKTQRIAPGFVFAPGITYQLNDKETLVNQSAGKDYVVYDVIYFNETDPD
jgi:hypothetical protein